MGTLILFNTLLIAIIVANLVVVKTYVNSERAERLMFLISALITIICHYSSLIYILFTGGDALAYLNYNPNLLLPIYPCNIVMWCCLIYGCLKNKDKKFRFFLSDYIFWFGLVSTLVGMFANVDFIVNPTLRDYEVTKSILAHATLLFNVLLIPVFGHLRPNFFRNIANIALSILMMYVIGLYCNLIFKALVSRDAAYNVNSMFIIHSPFEGAPFLRYPVIAVVGFVIYLIVFTVCDIINSPRENRWYNRAIHAMRKK